MEVIDPTGRAGVPAACASQQDVGAGTRFADCQATAVHVQLQAETTAALWAVPNAFVLDPLRDTFGPDKSVVQRGLGVLALAPVAGVIGHGVGLAADMRVGSLQQEMSLRQQILKQKLMRRYD